MSAFGFNVYGPLCARRYDSSDVATDADHHHQMDDEFGVVDTHIE